MDSLTHIALGAIVGEALAGRREGKKALLWGALAQSLPDIDFIASAWLDTAHDVAAHRGITHSFLFVLVAAALLALAARRIHRHRPFSYRDGFIFFAVELTLHILLDAFNAYGTGWLEPFSHMRFSFNVLFVADPFFSVWLGISLLALLILRNRSKATKFWIYFGLIASSGYLFYCVTNKFRIDARVKGELERQHIAYERYFTSPTPMNSWLWYVVAEAQDGSGYSVGYASVFDRDPSISFHFFPRNDSLLAPFREREDVKTLLTFSQGYYTVDRWEDRVVFNDLRFGQMRGWNDPQGRFVFHYYLQRPGENGIILQRGRFAGWNAQTLRQFLRRIGGKKE